MLNSTIANIAAMTTSFSSVSRPIHTNLDFSMASSPLWSCGYSPLALAIASPANVLISLSVGFFSSSSHNTHTYFLLVHMEMHSKLQQSLLDKY